MTEVQSKRKMWIFREPSPTYQRVVSSMVYGAGRASARLKHEKVQFAQKHKDFNDEVRAHNKANPENKKRSKSLEFTAVAWIWFSGFTKGMSMRLEQLKVEAASASTTPPPLSQVNQ